MIEGVLTINAGSSSVKYALFARDADLSASLLGGSIEGLGVGAGAMTHAQALAQTVERVRAAPGAVQVVAVGHRIVHGGSAFEQPALIDDAVESAIEALAPLAPLHQPHNLAGVRAARMAFPGVPQVACFDTAFHRTQPAVQQRFALPQRWHDAGVRRYGFHGLSYESVIGQLAATEPTLAQGRVVVAHLGNGASMCAMHEGRSVATTMSFSPLDGLTMGTRCGRLDAAVVLHLQRHHGMSSEEVGDLLYRQSGLLGLSGLSSDMRTLMASDTAAAKLAIEHFVESALRELAGLAAALRGLDALVFTGGIGENAEALRERIVQGAGWMGLRLDAKANAAGASRIDAQGSAVQLRVLRTNEETVIARHTVRHAAPTAAL
ncbi:MAG: acetate/propionate family kinase [Proteobacteria bacterium]|nr:acetate/propionate family kinase [Pseudomonadota bacterium]